MPKNNVLTIMVVVAIAIIIVVTYQNKSCPLVFDKTLKVGDLTVLLFNFSIIAALIERISNQFVLREESQAYSQALKGIFPVNFKELEYSDIKAVASNYKPKFYWLSFFLGMLIAAIGFRFFVQIIESPASSCSTQNAFVVYLDVMLTGMLLSGGSALIMEISKAMKPK